MGQREAEDVLGMITFMVSLYDHVAYVLLDPGASHSFVSEQFLKLTGIEPKLLEVILCVTTPLKDEVLISLGCSDCKIVVGGREEVIDLAVLVMHDFHVIIGMDWLVKQRALMNCSSKVI